MTGLIATLKLTSGQWLWMPLGLLATAVVAWAVWFLLDKKHRSIRPAKAHIRKRANKIWHRYRRLSNMVGVEPAIAPSVAEMLEKASSIYVRHGGGKLKELSKAETALEIAMARMLDLGEPESAHAQELLLSEGWAEPLAAEMEAMDLHLTRERTKPAGFSDAISQLREVRSELERTEQARLELDQR